MSRRTIAILIFVVGMFLLAIVLYFVIIGQDSPAPTPVATPGEGTVLPEGETGAVDPNAPTQEPTPENVIEVVVSLQTVPRGYLLTEDILTTEVRDAANVDTNVITDIDDIVGKYARNDIFQGQTLTFGSAVSDITLVGTEEFGPSSLIPAGFVAQAVPISNISSVAYGISEGDSVDVLLMFRFYQIDQEFQTLLPNDAIFYEERAADALEEAVDPDGDLVSQTDLQIYYVSPLGRFETLQSGDLAHISPAQAQRPVFIAMVVQNAKVIQVGEYVPPPPASDFLPTATPEYVEGEPTPTATPGVAFATSTPIPPDVVLLAMQPQQQLLLRYAIDTGADIDLALRGVNDGQLYPVQNVDVDYLLETFNIEIPQNFGFTVDTGPGVITFELGDLITPTPPSTDSGSGGDDGGGGNDS